MIDIVDSARGAPATFEGWRDALRFLLSHWRSEIALLARNLGNSRSSSPQVLVRFDEKSVVVSEIYRQSEVAVGELGKDDVSARSLATTLHSAEHFGGDIVLCLPADQVLRASIKMPPARRRALRGALSYEVERLTPIEGRDLYFDHSVGPRERAAHSVQVDLRLIKKTVVDSALATCRSAGASVSGIRFDGDDREADPFVFPVDRPAWLRSLWARYGAIALSGLALLLAGLSVLSVYQGRDADLSALSDQIGTESAQAARVERIVKQITDANHQLMALSAKKRAPMVIATLSAVTRLLPDGNWITNFSVEDNKVHIQGTSPEAAKLVDLIDRSGQFRNASFDAPLTQAPDQHSQHFALGFEIVPP